MRSYQENLFHPSLWQIIRKQVLTVIVIMPKEKPSGSSLMGDYDISVAYGLLMTIVMANEKKKHSALESNKINP